jgi:hypothetical protein
VNIGIASHIHAAASGGPRYLDTMTQQEREHISNAIWLCPDHASLIDKDYTRYPAEALRQMKCEHEDRVYQDVKTHTNRGAANAETDFVSIGPDFIFLGHQIAGNGDEWKFLIHEHVIGDMFTLNSYVDQFAAADQDEHYVLVNALGDGRQLVSPPTWEKTQLGCVVTCTVHASFQRMRAQDLPRDFALNENHDIFAKNGTFALVSGLDALPQRIKSCLSMLRGESPFYPKFGARLKEYFDLFQSSPWIHGLVKLEVIRLASIPYKAPTDNQQFTPLMSVTRVLSVEMLPRGIKADWHPYHFKLTVEGVGFWERNIEVFIPHGERPAALVQAN